MKKKFMWFMVALIIVGAIVYYLRPTEYTVTQYASESGNQSLIYSITDNKGHLVLVDGGWEQDAEQVKKIINANGGKVVNNPASVSLLSGDRKPQIRFLGNHHSGDGNLYHKSFRM